MLFRSKFGSNFGDNAAISMQKELQVYLKTRDTNKVFNKQFETQISNLSEGSFAKEYLSKLGGVTAGPELQKKLQFAESRTFNPQDQLILGQLLDSNQRVAKNTETIKDSAKVQEDYAKRLLDLQNKLNYGGGMRTSIDANAKLDAAKATQRGALQYQLGSVFGSPETQVAGLTKIGRAHV